MTLRAAWRLVPPVAVLGLVLARWGLAPFAAGLAGVTPVAVAVALVLSLLTTVCCAWRWQAVAEGMGAGLPLGRAVAAYYRAQLLNLALPFGVAGDLHRGVSHGRNGGDTWRGLRSVVGERFLGQLVAAGVTATALLLTPLPVPGALRWSLLAVLGVTLLVVGVRWPRVVGSSVVVALVHGLLFLVALHATRADLAPQRALPLALVVLLLGSVPLNLAGWGLREGAAAWVFGLAGVGAQVGVAASVTYGVLSLLAALPGVVVLLRPGVLADA